MNCKNFQKTSQNKTSFYSTTYSASLLFVYRLIISGWHRKEKGFNLDPIKVKSSENNRKSQM